MKIGQKKLPVQLYLQCFEWLKVVRNVGRLNGRLEEKFLVND